MRPKTQSYWYGSRVRTINLLLGLEQLALTYVPLVMATKLQVPRLPQQLNWPPGRR